LIALPNQLLPIGVDFLLQLKVFLQEGIPFTLALSFTPLVLLDEPPELAELLALRLQDVREVVWVVAGALVWIHLHCTLDSFSELLELVLLVLTFTTHLIQLCLE